MGRGALAIWLQFIRRFLVGILLIYVVVILSLGGAPAAKWTLYGFSALWLLTLIALSLNEGRLKLPQLAIRWLEVIATNVALLLLLGELALQVWCGLTGGSLLVRANLHAHRLAPGHNYGAGLVGNSLGYPGPDFGPEKQPGILRIAALGDSFAVGPAVAFKDNYLTRLGDEVPDCEVANFGVSGAGPREYREILDRDVWNVRPDIILLSIFVGNDITEALPRPRSFDPRHHALYLLCERGWKMAREAWTKTELGKPFGQPDRLGGATLSLHTFREVEARRLSVCLKHSAPAMEKKWRRTFDELDGIVQSCRRRGITLLVLLIPDEFQVNGAVLSQALKDSGLAEEQIDLDGPQRRLLAFFNERNIPSLDLMPAFCGTADTYARCDTHWNVAGNYIAAKEIGAWLRKINR